MSEELNDAEIENLMWLLLHGGDVLESDWREWRHSEKRVLDTDLRRRGFVEVYLVARRRVRVTEKGRRAVKGGLK